MALLLAVAACVYALDRLTKSWALANLTPGVPQEFLGDWLRLNLIFNPGAAFSLGTGLTPLFTVMMVLVSLAIVVSWRRLGSWGWAVALGLLLGGAQGNLTDRLTRPPGFGVGHVVDFLQLPYWPVFNIADSSVVSAAVLVALLAVRDVPFSGVRRPRPESGVDGSSAVGRTGGPGGHGGDG